MSKQSPAAALSLVQSVKAPKAKRPSKADQIAQLEKQLEARQDRITELNEQLSEHREDSSNRVAILKSEIERLENPEQSEVIETVKTAFRKSNRLAAVWGFIKGGWAPIASFDIVHRQLPEASGQFFGLFDKQQTLLVLVVGALLFSAPNVYQWCNAAFRNAWKAVGFVVLIEGVLVFSQSAWLAWSALALLIAINGIQSACNLSTRKPEFKF